MRNLDRLIVYPTLSWPDRAPDLFPQDIVLEAE